MAQAWLRSASAGQQAAVRTGRLRFSVFVGNLRAKDDCKKLAESKKVGITCRKPDLKKKPAPPYKYGYCREAPIPKMMACPPKIKKLAKGPCCHEEAKKGGGCRATK